MINKRRSNIDLDDTVELPVIDEQDLNIKTKDPMRIIFAFITKAGIFLLSVLLVTLVTRAIYVNVHKTEITLVDNTRIIFTGTNGNGSAQFHNAPEKQALTLLQSAKKESENSNKDTTDINELINSISCSFSQKENLTNGMQITYGCSYNVQAAKKAKFKIKDTSKEYTVMGLLDSTNSYENNAVTNPFILGFQNPTKALEKNYIQSNTSNNTIQYNYMSDSLKKSIEDTAQNELDSFNQIIIFGKEELNTYSPMFESIVLNDDGTYTITLSLSNIYTETLSDYYRFTISYTGTFTTDKYGITTFNTATEHEPYYDGYQMDYEVKKRT